MLSCNGFRSQEMHSQVLYYGRILPFIYLLTDAPPFLQKEALLAMVQILP